MKIAGVLVALGAFALTSCGGASTTASTEAAQAVPAGDAVVDLSSAPNDTMPALLDPSTDIDAIESPVVLWFWSPG
ncbi:MAG: hypothetical protein ACKOI2_08205 [Actinomycetota bacterium]